MCDRFLVIIRVLVENFWCHCKLLSTSALHKTEGSLNFFNLLDSDLSGLRFCLGHLNFGDSNLFRISGLSGLGVYEYCGSEKVRYCYVHVATGSCMKINENMKASDSCKIRVTICFFWKALR